MTQKQNHPLFDSLHVKCKSCGVRTLHEIVSVSDEVNLICSQCGSSFFLQDTKNKIGIKCQSCNEMFTEYECDFCNDYPKDELCKECHCEISHKKIIIGKNVPKCGNIKPLKAEDRQFDPRQPAYYLKKEIAPWKLPDK